MHIIGIESKMTGTDNQIRGIVLQGAKLLKKGEKVPVSRKALLKAPDGTILHPKNFSSLTDFKKAVEASVDAYLKEKKAPDFVVLPFDQAKNKEENNDVDLLSFVIKKVFKTRGYRVKTMVLLSNLYDYKSVDLINVGKHQLSDLDEAVLKSNLKLKSKVVETLGAASNINWKTIRNLAHQPAIEKVLAKYQSSKEVPVEKLLTEKGGERGKKTVLFSVGGMTDNGAINFDIKDAATLIKASRNLQKRGYNVIFTNSRRTPSDVTDYLFEKCKLYRMEFFNSKKIAQNNEETKNFCNYSGKYKKEFEKQAKNIGNIYPAVLNVCEFVVNTHDSFSYTSDAAALGIPSVVYTGNFIDEKRRPDCYKLFDLCHEKGYVISLDEAIRKIERGEEIKTKKMDDVSTQLVGAMVKSLGLEHQNANFVCKQLSANAKSGRGS